MATRSRRKYVVSVSSGLGSAYAWYVTAKEHPGKTIGVFADVNGEHPDNYRFLKEITQEIGAPLVTLDNNDQTIWDVFKSNRFLGNTRVDLCSRILKREPILRYLNEHHDPTWTTVVLGIDWTEEHRFIRAKARWAESGWTAAAPLCDRAHDKSDAEKWLKEIGIRRPALYDLGFPHANCGGGCVKAGIKHFSHMLKVLPESYRDWENREQEMREYLGSDVSILRDRRGGSVRPLTLRELRLRHDEIPMDDEDWGACGCFTGV